MKVAKSMLNDKQFYGMPYYILALRCARDFILISLNFLSKFSSDYPDNLNVYDGPNANAGMITSITGNDLPDDLYSTGSEIFLQFQSDSYGNYYGFKIWFSTGNFS